MSVDIYIGPKSSLDCLDVHSPKVDSPFSCSSGRRQNTIPYPFLRVPVNKDGAGGRCLPFLNSANVGKVSHQLATHNLCNITRSATVFFINEC